MRVLVISADSGIGEALVNRHRQLGDELTSTTRNGRPGGEHLELTQRRTWKPFPPQDRVYFCLAIGGAKVTSLEVLHVNCLLTVEYLGFLAKSTSTTELVVLTSRAGSIAITEEKGDLRGMPYKMSKAALNMGVTCLTKIYPAVRWVLLHPGLVDTKILDKTFTEPRLTPDAAADRIITTLSKPERHPFIDLDGRRLPW
jgi:NAD(P)-dependent dehydrogenase (short-subunit alcohol dehydrogenase family)